MDPVSHPGHRLGAVNRNRVVGRAPPSGVQPLGVAATEGFESGNGHLIAHRKQHQGSTFVTVGIGLESGPWRGFGQCLEVAENFSVPQRPTAGLDPGHGFLRRDRVIEGGPGEELVDVHPLHPLQRGATREREQQPARVREAKDTVNELVHAIPRSRSSER